MLAVKRETTHQNFETMASEREYTASLMSNEEIFITIARNILINPTLTFDNKLVLLTSAIPEKELVLQTMRQLYAASQIDWDEYVLLDSYFCNRLNLKEIRNS